VTIPILCTLRWPQVEMVVCMKHVDFKPYAENVAADVDYNDANQTARRVQLEGQGNAFVLHQ
jgi:hypothetical protein